MTSFKSTILRMNSSKGYTLLFAVIVSVLVLSIAAFILSVSRKQFILSSSARDSVYAFYAADSGLECAIENVDALATSSPTEKIHIQCGGKDIEATLQGNSDTEGTTTFSMLTGTGTFNGNSNDPKTQSGAASCAALTVSYTATPGKPGTPAVKDETTGEITKEAVPGVAGEKTVVVSSRGYNIGWNQGTSDCSTPGPRKVERALEYIQYQ